MDVGAHKGAFAFEMAKRYDCRIFGYEPIHTFAVEARNRTLRVGRVTIDEYGLGRTTGWRSFGLKGDMTGQWAEGAEIGVRIVSISEELPRIYSGMAINGGFDFDLMKINIEGGEYELLEAILDLGYARRLTNIQVQFHGIMQLDPINRRDRIRERLRETHEEMYCEPFVWEGWRLK
jgi:hypothetical protein